eukprot:GILK01009307.1.p1 GENE.GILK01009307.1~~GILK01009307.1.p1  ORF type:complete len:283 (-),score=42.71 GILK01009307.1:119-967(-)
MEYSAYEKHTELLPPTNGEPAKSKRTSKLRVVTLVLALAGLVAGVVMVTVSLTSTSSSATAIVTASQPVTDEFTKTGIPLDTEWKKQVWAFAVQHVTHPAWGLAHSERDYQNSVRNAAANGLQVDLDVLFAAAFLHDLGALAGWAIPGVSHGKRSADLAGPWLEQWGFPKGKIAQVQSVMINHVEDILPPAAMPVEDTVFRDVDLLDFIGDIGVARLISTTQEEHGVKGTIGEITKQLDEFAQLFPPQLRTETAKQEAQERCAEMKDFLGRLDKYTYDGKAL